MKSPRGLVLFLCLHALASCAYCLEADTLLDELALQEKSPRLLNSEDIQLKSSTPLPLFSPTGDFNSDHLTDMALSGIYNLPGKGLRYFLLVGTERLDPRRSEALFFKEYAQPVFIHKAGSTGEGDPGNQSFSISFCLDCAQGFDFFWDKKEEKFFAKAWPPEQKRLSAKPVPPPVEISTETVDSALKIVGVLKDVQEFVARLKKEGKELQTRVEPLPGANTANPVVVKIFEKKKPADVLYDAITVDVVGKKVVARKKTEDLTKRGEVMLNNPVGVLRI